MADEKKGLKAESGTDTEKIIELLRQIQLIVENSHDAIIGETLDGVITSWNGGATKMFGYTPEEAIGQSFLFLLPPERKYEETMLLNKIKTGEVVADYDSVRLCKNGMKIAVALSISPIKSEDSTLIGASIVERDITVRKKSEDAMRQVQLIVQNSSEAIIGATLEGIITSWNKGAQKIFGYTAAEAIGRSGIFLFPLELYGELPNLFGRVKAGETIIDYESERLRKDGVRISTSLSLSPIIGEEGVITGVSLVERDISTRKEEEQHIKELNEVRSRFISIVNHQLRTPLTAVNWNLEALLNGDYGKLEESQHKFLQATHASSVEITRRIHLLLTAMDIQEGRVLYRETAVDLASLVAGVVAEMKKKCELKNLELAYTPLDKGSLVISGDSEKIRMAISSLLYNAINYSSENGRIDLSLGIKGNAVRLSISDAGIGIPQAEQHLIFTRFFRASNASIMQPDAFGLGLYVAKNFIERHHGSIGFNSEEGKGSLFWFELPLKIDTVVPDIKSVDPVVDAIIAAKSL